MQLDPQVQQVLHRTCASQNGCMPGGIPGIPGGGGVGAFTVLFSIYPLLTLILINSSFKAHLDR